QRLQRRRYVPDHRRVRHGEPADLGPPAVVPRDGLGVDPATGVGHQLRARSREVAQVVADRREQRLGRVLAALATQPAYLVADEVDAFPVPGEPARVDDARPGLAEPVRERLSLGATGVQYDQADLRVRVARVPQQRGDQVLLRVLPVAQHQDLTAAEQRRAQQLGELASHERAGLQVAY